VDLFSELFSFQGRANRAWYFWHQLLDGFVIAALVMMLVMVGFFTGNMALILPAIGVMVGGVVAGAAVTVKRLHDLDRPGWHVLGLLVPLYNIYLGLVLLLKRGNYGFNDYGRDPLAPPTPVDYLEG
jgi:uncharacterized membrane protein YhaH (DUF805 family)